MNDADVPEGHNQTRHAQARILRRVHVPAVAIVSPTPVALHAEGSVAVWARAKPARSRGKRSRGIRGVMLDNLRRLMGSKQPKLEMLVDGLMVIRRTLYNYRFMLLNSNDFTPEKDHQC